jgi:Zn finger protein HypA/HybF involved in hydrogenase expression
MNMGVMEQMTTALTLTLDNARELQRCIVRYKHRKITREQFVAGVEELSTKTILIAGRALSVEQQRTERCKACDRTYPESEIVKRDGEQLCQQCDLDKYPIRDEDIPF